MPTKRILLALAGTSVDPDLIRYAIILAKATKAEVTAIHVIEVRWNLALDAVLEPELDRGEEILASAAKIAQQAGGSLQAELLQAREAAAAIIDTARQRQSDLVVIGMPYRQRLGKVYVGRTVQDVYVGAPCAVLAYRQEQPQ